MIRPQQDIGGSRGINHGGSIGVLAYWRVEKMNLVWRLQETKVIENKMDISTLTPTLH